MSDDSLWKLIGQLPDISDLLSRLPSPISKPLTWVWTLLALIGIRSLYRNAQKWLQRRARQAALTYTQIDLLPAHEGLSILRVEGADRLFASFNLINFSPRHDFLLQTLEVRIDSALDATVMSRIFPKAKTTPITLDASISDSQRKLLSKSDVKLNCRLVGTFRSRKPLRIDRGFTFNGVRVTAPP